VRSEPLKTEDGLTVANVFRLAVGFRLLGLRRRLPPSPSVEQVVDGCVGYVERKLADDGDWTLLLLSGPPRERLGLDLGRRPVRSEEGLRPHHEASREQGGGPAARGRPEINREPVRILRPEEAAGTDLNESQRIVAAYQPSPPFEALAVWKAKLCELDVRRRDAVRAARTDDPHVTDGDAELHPLDMVPDRRLGPAESVEQLDELDQRVRAIEDAISALPNAIDQTIAGVRWSQRRDLGSTGGWEEALDQLATAGIEISGQAARQRLRRIVDRAALTDYLAEVADETKRLLPGPEEAANADTELEEVAKQRWNADRDLRDRYKRLTPLGALRDHEKPTPHAEPTATQAGEASATWPDELAASDEIGHAVLVALLGLAALSTVERLAKVSQEIEECFGFTEDEHQLRRRVRSLVVSAPEDLRSQVLALMD